MLDLRDHYLVSSKELTALRQALALLSQHAQSTLDRLDAVPCLQITQKDAAIPVVDGPPVGNEQAEAAVKQTPAPAPSDAEQAPKAPKRPNNATKTRISFPMLVRKIEEQHGKQVLDYMLKNMCGTERTATRLKAALATFVGVFANNEKAGWAYSEANGLNCADAKQAVASLSNCYNKITLDDGRLAIWSNDNRVVRHRRPDEVVPGETDKSHPWHQMVQKTQEETEEEVVAEPEAEESEQTLEAKAAHIDKEQLADFC